MFYIEGNHDKAAFIDVVNSGIEHWTAIFSNNDNKGIVYLETGKPKIVDNLYIVGVGYQPKQQLVETLKGLDKPINNLTKVLMLHISCSEFTNFNLENSFSVKENEELLSYWDYVIIGDTHVHKSFKINNKTNILSPGSIEMISSSEDINKFVYSIDLQNKLLSDIKVNTRACYKITYNKQEINAEDISYLKSISSENPLIYLNVNQDIIGLSRVYSCFNLDQSILRIKFLKSKLNNNANSLLDNLENNDNILNIKDFIKQFIDYKNKDLSDNIANILLKLSDNETEVDTREVLTTFELEK